jgi:hypothetical protein
MVYILSQLMRLITGTNKNGRTMLLYRTIAPRKLTVNPIDSKKENEKKTQNQINEVDFTPFVRQNKNRKNKSRRNAVSDAAAMERICFTSPGWGRRVVELIACGVFIKKLPSVGFNSGRSIPEFPCNDLKACCLSTTACGKSRPGKIYLNEKKSKPDIK